MADIDGVILTLGDADRIRAVLDFIEQFKRNMPHFQREALPQAPDVYIVQAPGSGIPAATLGAGTGTGSSIASPGVAVCRCYRATDDGATRHLVPIGRYIDVYNPGSAIAPNSIVIAVKEKPGKYIAVMSLGTGDTIRFTQPANDGATPPKPKLESHAEVDYDLATDTVFLTGIKYWARDMNK